MSEDAILTAIAALDAKVSTLDSKVSNLDSSIVTLRVDMLARFDRMENRLTLMQDEVAVSTGRAERAHSASDSVRDELRMLSKEVAILTRKQRIIEAQVYELTKPQNDSLSGL